MLIFSQVLFTGSFICDDCNQLYYYWATCLDCEKELCDGCWEKGQHEQNGKCLNQATEN